MKIPKQELKKMLSTIVPLLAVAHEETEVVKKRLGSTLKNFLNIHHDMHGKPIIETHEYTRVEKVSVKINHVRRIHAIVDRAKNMQELETRIGYYVAKYAKDRKAVSDIAQGKD